MLPRVFALPVAGLVMGVLLQKWGGAVRRGNNLVIDTVHDSKERIPLSVVPWILGGTVLTHLFGGSGGRERSRYRRTAASASPIRIIAMTRVSNNSGVSHDRDISTVQK